MVADRLPVLMWATEHTIRMSLEMWRMREADPAKIRWNLARMRWGGKSSS